MHSQETMKDKLNQPLHIMDRVITVHGMGEIKHIRHDGTITVEIGEIPVELNAEDVTRYEGP